MDNHPGKDLYVPTRRDIEARQLWRQYESIGDQQTYSNRERLIARRAIWLCAVRLGVDRLLLQEDKEGMIPDDMKELDRITGASIVINNPLKGDRVSHGSKSAFFKINEPTPEKTVNLTIPTDLPMNQFTAVIAQYIKQYGMPTLVFNDGDKNV